MFSKLQGETYRSVTCLRVDGSAAVVGGVITRGGPGLGDRDLVSPMLIDPLGTTAWPDGFPRVCPSLTEIPGGGPPMYRELDEGDIVVKEASNG